ncbi:bifunctional diguanylate cyclase/phosphodiesterase [Pseudobutyrivibrio sp.]|uniref:bifunctional diguanylate cyclase/phosphodiesterase n=1 Tax=Pseudobutyrivibrio sp. TaxID=2014367 RepID=UPI001D1CAE5C|nr:GGDEF domain-containing protein [Pseudobutyrivibrio sp.]MBE5912380.1 GGDEF domain-containing protein [Pseudobutyrivibrio sp.]
MIVRDESMDKAKYLLSSFDRALKDEWIEVYYQPLVRASNGRVCNEEALVRWNDPILGIINPPDFIPILEAVNVVHRLDLYVLEHVLAKMTLQKNEGLFVVPTSINLSTMDFYYCDIVSEVCSRVDASGVGRENIAIEIAEAATARHNEQVLCQLDRFKEYGFQIWMDDYGGGDSSPILLQRIHFDLLKINIGLIQQIRFDETSRVIITELIRMAMALGIETSAEGVEDQDQVDFLQEVGCSKMQGFYYCRPIPMEIIFDRYRNGTQIGFENPEESDYYSQVGKVSLYDLSFSGNDDEQLNDYFDTMPMAIAEVNGKNISLVRTNRNFKKFLSLTALRNIGDVKASLDEITSGPGYYTLKSIVECAETGKRRIIDDRTSSGKSFQVLLQKVAENNVTGVSAITIVVLSVVESTMNEDSLTYNYVARALAEDYVQLFFVNTKTEEYVKYKSDGIHRDVSVDNRGKDFFSGRKDSESRMVYKDDLELVVNSFTKEKVLDAIKENGVFNITYRAMIDGKPTYVMLKAVKIRADDDHIIVGISNVDAQMRQKEAMERIKEERVTYSRIAALSGDFICIYAVDPETSHYRLYKTTYQYQNLKIESEGDDFFSDSAENSKGVVDPEDIDNLLSVLTKDHVMKQIEENGLFVHTYRLYLDGFPRYVSLKGALVDELNGPQLLFGVVNVDEQVRKDIEYKKQIIQAESKAVVDELTGVKNKRAYLDMEDKLNEQIKNSEDLEFAIIMCDLNGLKKVNDTLGHKAGDDFIIRGCEIICTAFAHSPVYRAGGDEFIVIAKGTDYEALDRRIEKINRINAKNAKNSDVTMAVGVAKFCQDDHFVSDVFERADSNMYENKRKMKMKQSS